MKLFKKKKNIYKFKYSKFKSVKHYYKTKKVLPSGVSICFGSRGCGKSTDIGKAYYLWEKERYKRGKESTYTSFYSNNRIFTNSNDYHYLDLYTYKFTDYIDPNLSDEFHDYFTTPKFGDTSFKIGKNSVIYLDEVGLLYLNRSWKSFPKELTNFIKLCRHFGIKFVMYSQNYDLDKSLRDGASDLHILRRYGVFTIKQRIKKYIAVSDTDMENNADSQICDKVSICSIFEPHAISITFIPFYTDLFNSFC